MTTDIATEEAPRWFVVDRRGETSVQSYREYVEAVGVPEAVVAAADLLLDNGFSPEKAADMALTFHRGWTTGRLKREPVEMAHHLIKLRGVLRK